MQMNMIAVDRENKISTGNELRETRLLRQRS